MKERRRGLTVFAVAILLYAGMLLLSWMGYKQESQTEAEWARLDSAEARLLFRNFLFLKYMDSGGEPPQNAMLFDLLWEAGNGWKKALESQPDDLQVRFALAVCQREFGTQETAGTILSAPDAQQKMPEYEALRSLVLSSTPDLELLQQDRVKSFISQSPVKRLWLASIYSRLGMKEEIEEQWRLGYEESYPYAITCLIVLALWWGVFPLIGIICALTLIRRKGVSSPPAADNLQPAEAGANHSRLTLGQASEGFLVWLALNLVGSGGIAIATEFFGLQSLFALGMMLCSFIAAILAAGWVRIRTRYSISLGWRGSPFGLHLRVALAIFLLGPIGMGLARLLQYHFGVEFREPSVLLIAGGKSVLLRVLWLISACIIVPIAEETIFRGLLFKGLRRQWGILAGMLISSAVFSIGHLDLITALPLFIFSLGLAWSVERTGSLVPAAIAHSLFNLFPLLLLNVMTL
jgi:membrane protease YdiL (CAAX protease family)